MRDLPFSSSTFPVASCAACGVTVLTYLALNQAGEIGRCCVRCDQPITTLVEAANVSELAEHGYQVGTPKPRAGGGCGGQCGRAKHSD